MILLLLTAVVGSSILDRVLPRVSLPLVQVLLGALIALVVTTPLEWGIDPELLLILFIAPLHFNESRHVDSSELWRNRWGIASLSVGLVFAIAISMGFALHALLPTIPLAAALALGSAMGSTDAVATTSLARSVHFGTHHEALLKGEALFNDVTGTVMFSCCIAVLAQGSFSPMEAGEEFALDFFGGMVFGVIAGGLAWLFLRLIRRAGLDDPTLHVMLELLFPFIIYLAAKSVHVGAIIAVVLSGMMMSLLPERYNASLAKYRVQSASVWETLEFAFNGIIFTILGMQLPRLLQPISDEHGAAPLLLIAIILILTVVLMAVRCIWIIGMDMVGKRAHAKSVKLNKKEVLSALAMTFAGSKGGITLSLTLTFPAIAPGIDANTRPLIISLAAGIIVCTLLLANFALPRLATPKAEKQPLKMADMQIDIILKVMGTIIEDAAHTGSVRDEKAQSARADGQSIDEPATIIVLERYAKVLQELARQASKEKAVQARSETKRVEALYETAKKFEDEMREMADDDNALAHEDRWVRARAVKDAVSDVQAQAFVRELEIIRDLHASGKLSDEHARQLQNDVYIQQVAL